MLKVCGVTARVGENWGLIPVPVFLTSCDLKCQVPGPSSSSVKKKVFQGCQRGLGKSEQRGLTVKSSAWQLTQV